MVDVRIQKLEDLLLVNVPPQLDDSEVIHLRRLTLQAAKQHRSRWVLLDFSQVDVCDSFFGRFIHSMTETVRMMGARVVVSALQDAVVETLVEMGFTFPGVHAVLDLDDALALSREASEIEETSIDELLAATPDADLLAAMLVDGTQDASVKP
ncbi:MAG: STAS domain-containing protein [Deltaproteobacteria bacterium]|nr:STAS domain-containing protein [Deltaproteobacteria bacterium]